MLQAVLFDVDGVLLDSLEANHAFFTYLFTKFGYTPPTRDEYKEMIHMSLWDCIAFVTKLESKEEIQRIWDYTLIEGNLPSTKHLMKVPDGLETVIEQLAANYKLGIVSSRNRPSIYKFPELEALRKYFAVTITYEDTINHKPHPEPILLAFKKLQIKPEEAVYIGDMPTDLQAAAAAGTKSILYAKQKLKEADAWTDTFRDLPEIIKTLSKS